MAYLESQFLLGCTEENFDTPTFHVGLQHFFRDIVAIADQ
jgi:hypothetical protein